jgi:chorismate synthase
LVAVLDGVPAGVEVTSEQISKELARRRLGYGRGARMSFEQDVVTIIGGVRHGVTLGSPVAIEVGNSEWPKWETVMAADPVDPAVLEGQARNAPLTARARGTRTSRECRNTATPTRGRSWNARVRGRRPPGSRSARSPRR